MNPLSRHRRLAVAATAATLLAATAIPVSAAKYGSQPENPNWPCQQRKVPELSMGTMWAGPKVDLEAKAWNKDPQVRQLVDRLSKRRVEIEDAQKQIEDFASRLPDGARKEKLTELFGGLFAEINSERKEIVNGIERFTKHQRDLAETVQKDRRDLDDLQDRQDTLSDQEKERLNQLQQKFQWDVRVFHERHESLRYVCESPVILEQRIFSLARTLAQNIEQ